MYTIVFTAYQVVGQWTVILNIWNCRIAHRTFFDLLECYYPSDSIHRISDGLSFDLLCPARQFWWQHNALHTRILNPSAAVGYRVQSFPRIYRMDQKIMTAETFKRGRSASLWNWLGMRFDHHHQQQREDRKSTGTKDSCKVKLLPGSFESERMKVADVTPAAAVADFHLSCLTLAESPRRWNPKRMRRPVSCYILPVGDVNRSYSETHFPSEPIPQRVRTAGSIQNLVSFDASIYDQHQVTCNEFSNSASLINRQSFFFFLSMIDCVCR